MVGASTFGKGSVQTIIDLPGGAGMRLTTERYYPLRAATRCRPKGSTPDVLVELNHESAIAAFPIRHERDLEGHLEAERRSQGAYRVAPSDLPRAAGDPNRRSHAASVRGFRPPLEPHPKEATRGAYPRIP